MSVKDILLLFDPEQKIKIQFSTYTIRGLQVPSPLLQNAHYEPDNGIIKGTARFLLSNLPTWILNTERNSKFKVDNSDNEYIRI